MYFEFSRYDRSYEIVLPYIKIDMSKRGWEIFDYKLRESTVKVLEAEEGTRSGHSGVSVARNVFTMHPHLNNSFTYFCVEYEIKCERVFS